MKICFISRYDSFVNLAKNYAVLFKQNNWDVKFVILDEGKLNLNFLSKIEKDLEDNEIVKLNYQKSIFQENDAIFFCLTGGYIKRILKSNNLMFTKDRPYLITAYPGVVYQNIYDGFSSRSFVI